MTAIESCWKGDIEKGLFVMCRVDGKEYKTLPLGICYLAAALRKNEYCCDILDGNLDFPAIDEMVDKAVNYDMVGISLKASATYLYC